MTTKELFEYLYRCEAVRLNNALCEVTWYDVGESVKGEQAVSIEGFLYFKESDVETVDIVDDEVIVKVKGDKSLLYFKFLERISF